MFDVVFKKFKEKLKKDYPDYEFYITDDLEAEDFVINSVICEISNITIHNPKHYNATLNFYIIKPKVQDDLGSFILQALDIQKKIQDLDENKKIVGWEERPDGQMVRYLMSTLGRKEGFGENIDVTTAGNPLSQGITIEVIDKREQVRTDDNTDN